MKVVCISKEVTGGGLTFGGKYDVIERGSNPNSRFNLDSFLLINDNGLEMWYDKAPIVFEVLPLTGYSIKYIGMSSSGLTFDKFYEVLDKEIGGEYYNFIDDNNRFVGIPKINYFGGESNFIEITKIRENKLDTILKKHHF
jgi:hypothetical protein